MWAPNTKCIYIFVRLFWYIYKTKIENRSQVRMEDKKLRSSAKCVIPQKCSKCTPCKYYTREISLWCELIHSTCAWLEQIKIVFFCLFVWWFTWTWNECVTAECIECMDLVMKHRLWHLSVFIYPTDFPMESLFVIHCTLINFNKILGKYISLTKYMNDISRSISPAHCSPCNSDP